MPPNRKTTDLYEKHDLPTLDASALKLPKEAPPPSCPESSLACYWDWPADTNDAVVVDVDVVVSSKQIQFEAKRARRLVSANHIAAKLQQDARERIQQQQGEETTTATVIHGTCSSADDNDDYWDMPTTAADVQLPDDNENDDPAAPAEQPPVHDAAVYWEWPAAAGQEERNERYVQGVLEAQRARRLTSVAHVQARLVRQAALSCAETTSPSAVAQVAANDAYWVF